MWLTSTHWFCCENQCDLLRLRSTVCILQTSKEKKLIDWAILPEGKVNSQ